MATTLTMATHTHHGNRYAQETPSPPTVARGYMEYGRYGTNRVRSCVGMRIHMPAKKAVFLPNFKRTNCQSGIHRMVETSRRAMT